MISYCAQGCILEWQTMLPKEVFIFFGRKIRFPFFEYPNWVFLWRSYNIFVAKLYQINFRKYYDIFSAQLTKWLGVKSLDPPLMKRTNSRRFSRKSGSNLSCSYHIVCSLFFPKIISRYISIYLIRETSKGLQDSTTS